MSKIGEPVKPVVGQSHETGRDAGVYHLGFWDGDKRDERVQSYRDQGHDERTAHLKTRADEMKDLERDPGYRQASAEDRADAMEQQQKHDREEVSGRDTGRFATRYRPLPSDVERFEKLDKAQQRAREDPSVGNKVRAELAAVKELGPLAARDASALARDIAVDGARAVQRSTSATVERVRTVAAQVARKMMQDRARESGRGRDR